MAQDNPTLYRIHNLGRDVETRHIRAQHQAVKKSTLLLGGGLVRVARGTNVLVAEVTIRRLVRELIELEKKGLVKVTTGPGARVDIASLSPVEDPPPEKPLPNKLLDSAANDKTFEQGVGEKLPSLSGGKPLTAEVPVPEVVVEAAQQFGDPEEGIETPVIEQAPPQEEVAQEDAPAPSEESRGGKKGKRR